MSQWSKISPLGLGTNLGNEVRTRPTLTIKLSHNHFNSTSTVLHSFRINTCPPTAEKPSVISASHKMSSRFFHGGDSDSESSSSEEEELYGEEKREEESEEESSEEESESEEESSSDEEGGKVGASRFMKDVASSDESDDEEKVTVVKSAKDKRLEELEGTVRLIENAEKINDWAVISTGWCTRHDSLQSMLTVFVARIRQNEQTSRQDRPIRVNSEALCQDHFRFGRRYQ
jgi:Eukaryotic translation initiation factor 3 subunit 8 N-terminus